VEVWVDGRIVDVGHARQRCVLAVLLIEANRTVPAEIMVDRVWGGDGPRRPPNALHGYVSRLRKVLAAAHDVAIVRQPGGYRLRVDPDAVDLHRFHDLTARARSAENDAVAQELYRQALDLWRGRAFGSLDTRWLDGARTALHAARLSAELDHNDLALAHGAHADLLVGLATAAATYPLDERLAGQLMLALYRCGRQADALLHYEQLRKTLAGELRTDPSPPLRLLHKQILTADPALQPPAVGAPAPWPSAVGTTARGPASPGLRSEGSAATGATREGDAERAPGPARAQRAPRSTAPGPARAERAPRSTAARAQRAPTNTMPRQLPAAPPSFVGRARELAALDAALGPADRPAAAVVVFAVSGPAGVGKTALALHWGHRTADRFEDGQLHVNLRGFDPGGTTMSAAEALRGFLDALGVPAQRIPPTLEGRAALYRSVLATRRVLVVIDNARDADQVRPLLPAAPGCAVVVTSRTHLVGLVAGDGARPIPLDVLGPADSRDLLDGRLGPDRLAAEPAAVDDIVARCAGLPLALAIVAARAATMLYPPPSPSGPPPVPARPLRALADDLAETRTALNTLAGPDEASNLRTVLSWSYRALSPAAASMFRLLGLHPGPDINAAAAASLAGIGVDEARFRLDELTRCHLITQPAYGRYGCHDLLRAYAGELARDLDGAADRRAATRRMLDHYLGTAFAAAMLIDPHREPLRPLPARTDPPPERLDDHAAAMAWFTGVWPVLLGAIDVAAATGHDERALMLTWCVGDFLQRRGHWHDWESALLTALAAARRLGDRPGRAYVHRMLARALTPLGRFDDAHDHLRRALDIFGDLGDRSGQARTHRNIALVLERQGRYESALAHAEQTLRLRREDGSPAALANALNNVGWYHSLVGDHRRALDFCREALEINERIEDRYGQAAAWDSIGYAHHHLGEYDRAATCLGTALRLIREVGDRYSEATVLTHLGDTGDAAGRPDEAHELWRAALMILDELGHRDAETVRARLSDRGTTMA